MIIVVRRNYSMERTAERTFLAAVGRALFHGIVWTTSLKADRDMSDVHRRVLAKNTTHSVCTWRAPRDDVSTATAHNGTDVPGRRNTSRSYWVPR